VDTDQRAQRIDDGLTLEQRAAREQRDRQFTEGQAAERRRRKKRRAIGGPIVLAALVAFGTHSYYGDNPAKEDPQTLHIVESATAAGTAVDAGPFHFDIPGDPVDVARLRVVNHANCSCVRWYANAGDVRLEVLAIDNGERFTRDSARTALQDESAALIASAGGTTVSHDTITRDQITVHRFVADLSSTGRTMYLDLAAHGRWLVLMSATTTGSTRPAALANLSDSFDFTDYESRLTADT